MASKWEYSYLVVGELVWVVRIAGRCPAIRTTHTNSPTNASNGGASSQTKLALRVS